MRKSLRASSVRAVIWNDGEGDWDDQQAVEVNMPELGGATDLRHFDWDGDKAIDVIDEAGAQYRLEGGTHKKITVDEIERVVARMARVPIRTVSGSDRQRLRYLERDLKRVVFGQDPAIAAWWP